jgi:hypothetical protein
MLIVHVEIIYRIIWIMASLDKLVLTVNIILTSLIMTDFNGWFKFSFNGQFE